MTTGEAKVVLGVLLIVVSTGLIQGCSNDRANRLTYEMLQSRQQLECQKSLAQECPERQSYDSYQQQKTK